ncbi:MAG TPA: hypothetical protein VK084_04280 [Chitinophagaceae bacterium]|nr:hypothetical protein [Chitinophagaceae bacterium]
MKNLRKLLLSTMLMVFTLFLLSACSKDDKATPEENNTEDTTPDSNDNENMGIGSSSATITYMDTEESVQFIGTAVGVIGTGSPDSVIMTFSGKNSPMVFWLMITPADKGTHIMGQNNFECYGFFYKDSSINNLFEAYLVGEDNIDDNGTEMDGAASFKISSISNDQIKGTFELTMIQNSTVYENGELQSGEIKKIKVTNGKFDVPFSYGLGLE